ncbi:hypothetical protein Q4E40_02850 [Pontibacter sp. BT731]|uniref:hypothetical protein n=1 Tax=Pontibacter coccineus TaxID=3063328 RepID=UPI0026E4497C|nr:hypothetical protein [Pontibacter sp. BT731]MDO6389052.1 hypothetical protein [Pontibacter sp. BT731]
MEHNEKTALLQRMLELVENYNILIVVDFTEMGMNPYTFKIHDFNIDEVHESDKCYPYYPYALKAALEQVDELGIIDFN